MRAVLLIAVALFAAGCLGGSAPTSTLKDGSSKSGPPATNSTDKASPQAPTQMNMDGMLMDMNGYYSISYSGRSPQGACTTTGTPADQCQFASQGKEAFHLIDYKGKPEHLVLTIMYPAQQPGFAMYAAVCVGKAGAKLAVNDCKDYKTMPSPMKLDVDLGSAAANAPLGLSIGSVAGGPGAVVFGESDFKVDGHLRANP